MARWAWLGLVLVVAQAAELTDEEYYEMPRLFELDDFEECLAPRRGIFCLGSFELLPDTNDRLLDTIRVYSEDKFHFNHSHIHRGYCVSSRCARGEGATSRGRFERCVGNATRHRHGLRANLSRLEYCRAAASPAHPPPDNLDLGYACVFAAIMLMNVVGTAYDFLKSADSKPNRFLMPWSLRVNWGRLTADHSARDPRLAALKPVQGMKSITLILIMMAHIVLAHHIIYIANPLFLEKSSHEPLSALFQNGTSIVQTFVMASSFLMAYNLLLRADGDPKRQLNLKMLPKVLLHRLTRILPAYMLVVGGTTTWWARAGDGPLWAPLVGGECARCRDKWWTQLLFVNNLVRPDVKCLVHTWFLAVDMQLYALSAVLTLALGARPRRAVAALAGLLVAAVVGNFLAAYYFQLKPMVTLMFPEYMRTMFMNEPSFSWLYQAPWDSLPAALVGLLAAFLHHLMQRQHYSLKDKLWFRVVYRSSVPAMFAWVLCGYFMKRAAWRAGLALYAALDRPAFVLLTATAMLGFFHRVDQLWWRFLSWRGWEVLGRMSLSAYLLHWLHILSLLAVRSELSQASVNAIGALFLWTVYLTYLSAVPMHLLIELPTQKFLQALLP